EILGVTSNGRISDYLFELELSGFIRRDYTWNLSSAEDSKISTYRLSDNYLRFYLKYIEKNLNKINRDTYDLKSLGSLPEWNSIMGLQFENLVLNNRKLIHKAANIKTEDIVAENPFYQHKTKRIRGCQIDYMIQTKFNTLYICEIKFSKQVINYSVIQEVQQKIEELHSPKSFSYRPVLIHANGVSEDVVDSDYFTSIIDISRFFNSY
ncbi:MAG: ATPase, partial [Gammaproteobacteria bacterium]